MIGERLSDRYQIVDELGRGGMGVVFRAKDPVLAREVAIKLISLSQIDAESEERFRREAQIVAKMDHPAIVPIYDLGAHEDALFFVMPLVEGTTLKTLLRQRSLGIQEVLEVIAQVAEGLDYSHHRGVVHRDIKPENIMVSRETDLDASGEATALRARVMDFGLALAGAVSRLTKTGALPGTLVYLSPEQILSSEIDGRSDLYSLGTILFECLSGELPFSGSRYSLLYRIAHEPPPSLTKHGIDEGLARLVMRCLAKRSSERPARGNELAEALRNFASQLRPGDKPRPRTERPRREPSRRHSTPIVGRAEERRTLVRLLDETLAGECHFVLVGGNSGLGKTRLLEDLEDQAAARDIRTLHGHFSGESNFPYQGFGEVVQDHFRDAEASAADSDDRSDLSDLGADLLALFPFLLEVPALRTATSGERDPSLASATADRSRLHELLARTLTRIAADAPLVVLLEHLHASEAAVEALQYLVRRLGPLPILIAGTFRPSETGRRHAVTRLLHGVADDRRFTALQLSPLTREEHCELLATLLAGDQLDEALVRQLYLASEGNPFFIQELVRWMLEAGEIQRAADGMWSLSSDAAIVHDALPETIQQVVESRLEQLTDDRLRILQAASVLGRSFDYADLESVLGEDVEGVIDELEHEGLLEEDRASREDRLQFTSGIVRDVLYRGLSRRKRRSLHRRHAERLEERFAGRLHRIYPRLVQHFAEGDVPEKTIGYALELAREALAGFGSEAAIRALKTALEFIEDEIVEGGREAELRSLLAAALRAEGHLDAALKEAARAVRVAERGGAVNLAATAALCAAEISWQGRRIDETRQWVGRGSELARRSRETTTLRSLLTLGATLANLSGQYGQARAYQEEADTLLKPSTEAEEDVESDAAGGTLKTTLSNPLTTKELGRVFTMEEMEVLANVFEPLLTTDAEGNLLPRLAREWHSDDIGQRFYFHLDDRARFSDGERLTAADVKKAFERAARHGMDSPAPAFTAIRGCEEFLNGTSEGLDGVRLDGDRTVIFDLAEPLPIFPALLTDLRAAISRRGADGTLIGTGPFKLAGSEEAEAVVLERNDKVWDGRSPRLDSVHFYIVPQASEVAARLRSGTIDLGRDLLPDDLEDVLRDVRFRAGLVEATLKDVYYATFNAHGPVAGIPEIRLALCQGVRVQDIVWRVLKGFAQPATGLVPPGILGHDPGRRPAQMGRQEARRLIKSCGLKRPVLRGAAHPVFLDRFAAFTEALFEEWETLGVEIDLEEHSLESFLERTADPRDLDVRIGRWVHDYDDPDNFTYEMLHSRHGVLGGYLPSDGLDPLLLEARRESRPVRRQKLYREFEEEITAHGSVLPLFYDVNYRILGPQVKKLPMLASPPYVDYAAVVKGTRRAEPSDVVATLEGSGTIHVPSPGPVRSLAPEEALSAEAAEIVPNIFETLTKVEEGAHIVPRLAAEFRAEEGGRRYHFRLRPNVKFHDGRRLSARDVRFSFERLIKKQSPGSLSALMMIEGARDLRSGTRSELVGFKISSELEFVIKLERPMSFFPAALTAPMIAVVPEGARHFDRSWREGTVGTGPFRLLRFSPGELVELEANPYYWRSGYPRCDRIIFELHMNADQIADEFRAGRLQIAAQLRPADLRSLYREAAYAAGFREAPGISTYYLVLNRREGPLADDSRRQAFAAALEIEAAVRTLGRIAVPAHGLIPPGLVGQEGRGILTGSSDSSLLDLRATLSGLKLSCAVHPVYRDTYRTLWEHLRASLEAVGVELEESVHEQIQTSADHQSRPSADLVATRWYADYPDSDNFVSLLHSVNGIDGVYCGDERIDDLIDRGRAETHLALRHAVYHEIERILRREALIVPLFHEQVYRFARPEVQGLKLSLGCPEVTYEELSVKL